MWNYVRLYCCLWFIGPVTALEDVIVETEKRADSYVDADYAAYQHTTCEFDLASRFWATQPQNNYRPFPSQLFKDKCETMYRFPEQNKAEREKLFEEASVFGQWLSMLQAHEVKQSKRPLCDGGMYHEDTQLRQQMYARTRIWECYKLTDNIFYLNCLINRRKKMIAMIPKHWETAVPTPTTHRPTESTEPEQSKSGLKTKYEQLSFEMVLATAPTTACSDKIVA